MAYNPSEATRVISVALPASYLRLDPLPVTIYEGIPFIINGHLVDVAEMPIAGKTIELSYDGIVLGSVVTDMLGFFTLTVTIPTAGSYTLQAYFRGDAEYAASMDTAFFDVLVPPAIDTALTILAPASVLINETFTITGVLTRVDTGEALAGQTINVSYDGVAIGSVATDAAGGYSISAAIPAAGTYTLRAEFPGSVAAAASFATTVVGVGVEVPPLEPPLIAGIALAIVDIALVLYYGATQISK